MTGPYTAGEAMPYSPALSGVIEVARQGMHLPDPTAMVVGMATVAANRGPGDPVWTMVIGRSSGGKTEQIKPLRSLADVEKLDDLSPAGLVSGMKRRGATPYGVLSRIAATGKPGTMLVPDISALLSKLGAHHDESGASLMGLLRSAYDGEVARDLGTGTVTAEGKFGFVGACTPSIDRYGRALGELGTRFIYLRLPPLDEVEQCRAARARQGAVDTWRAALADAVAALFAPLAVARFPALTEAEGDYADALAILASHARAVVPRDEHREIDGPAEIEAPSRLLLQLLHLLGGLDAVGVDRAEGWRIITKAALDCMSQDRHHVLDHLAGLATVTTTRNIADVVDLPTTTTRRICEDLTASGLVSRSSGSGSDLFWELASAARKQWEHVNPAPAVPGTWRDEVEPTGDPTCSICGELCDPDFNPHPGCVGTGGAF